MECSICYEKDENSNSWYETNCKHRFHKICIEKWKRVQKNALCPCCRGTLDEISIVKNEKIMVYMKNHKLHREDGAAVTYFYPNGKTKRKEYYVDGKIHRKIKPAIEEWDINGKWVYGEWWEKGRRWRERGPKIIDYRRGICKTQY